MQNPESKTVTLTTTTHATAICIDLGMVVLGVAHAVGWTAHPSIDKAWEPWVVSLWALGHVMFASIALAGALLARFEPTPVITMGTEAVGRLGLSGVLLSYWWVLHSEAGWGGSLTTQVLLLAVGISGVARAIQIAKEMHLIRRARVEVNSH